MNNFTYRYTSMELLQFATLSNQFDPEDSITHNELRYYFDASENTIYCLFSVTLLRKSDDTPLLKAELQSGFEIKPESIAIITKGDDIIFPANIIAHFASLTYSSLRGIIYAKSEDTVFRNYVIPVQNIQAQIKKPFVYNNYRVVTEQ